MTPARAHSSWVTGLPFKVRQGFGVLRKLRARCLPVTLPLSAAWIGRPSYSSIPPPSFTPSRRVRRGGEIDLPDGHAQLGRSIRLCIDLVRGGEGSCRDFRGG